LAFIGGLVLFFFGWNHLKQTAFPLGILLLAIPLPAVIFYQITFPLQVVASKLGSFLLEVSRVPVLREGNVIILPNVTLQVAEACSGIRSLFTLCTLTILYGYLLEESTWLRISIVAFTIPLALFSNGLRIMGTGIMAQYVSPEAAEGFFHTFSGWIIFIIALVTLVSVHKLFTALRNATTKKKNEDRELIPI
jgi:exosortase